MVEVIPDVGNFDLGDQPVPDNFFDDSVTRAVTEHSRKESQIQSLQDDFATVIDKNSADNIAANLVGYLHDQPAQVAPPTAGNQQDDDDMRTSYDHEQQQQKDKDNQYGLDDMLLETVTAHKHRESRTDFVEQKLHEIFAGDEDDDAILGDTQTTPGNAGGGGKFDMSNIASNLVAFLHDDGADASAASQKESAEESGVPSSKKKARGSTDLSLLQQEINVLNAKVNKLQTQLHSEEDKNKHLTERLGGLEMKNVNLMQEIEHLQNSKTVLATNSVKCIDELRNMLSSYNSKAVK
mmetsp:Transcript_17586/g.27607  ORF Transcript_17586/g.27607 Transcript_17586/m.27607 type:complete len:295 (+) Transcript_17586:32-916(+)